MIYTMKFNPEISWLENKEPNFSGRFLYAVNCFFLDDNSPIVEISWDIDAPRVGDELNLSLSEVYSEILAKLAEEFQKNSRQNMKQAIKKAQTWFNDKSQKSNI